jgi:2'-5' RNA ligase
VRLFVAADVADDTRTEVGQLRGRIEAQLASARARPRLTWVKPDRAHVTLRFIGELADDRAAALAVAFGEPVRLAPFEVIWDEVATIPEGRGARVIVLRASAGGVQLAELASRVGERVDAVLGTDEPAHRAGGPTRAFRAHVTLARIREPGRRVDWPALLPAVRVTPTRTHVHVVTLYQSRLSPDGPTYGALARARLV